MFLFLLAAVFYQVQVPVASMHQAPDEKAQVISQANYSEEVKILETRDDWVRIETVDDHCSGWAKSEALLGRETLYADCTCVTPIVEVSCLGAPVYEGQSADAIPLLTLPFESRLEALDPFDHPDSAWITIRLLDDRLAYIQRKDITTEIHAIPKQDLAAFSHRFTHVPFTSGGRSSFGYDASGFVQMLYKQIGYMLPRQAREQFLWDGFETVPLDQLESGDLIFWGATPTNIQHAGLFIGDHQCIHADQQEIGIGDLSFFQEWPFCEGKRLK
jgi:gamma-D-glutamyl-L-lysine dipeptidyl-peptidase